MPAETVEYRPMSFEDYLALPDDVRAEYVDGVAIVTPPGNLGHQAAEGNVVFAIRSALRDVVVLPECGLRTGPSKYRFGDVVVLPAGGHDPTSRFAQMAPLVVLEVLSSSTRSEDTIRKSVEYRQAGVGQYWILDREEPCLIVHTQVEDGWERSLVLDADHPTGSVDVGDHGTVELDLDALLAT